MSKQIVKMNRKQMTAFANTLGWNDLGSFVRESDFDVTSDWANFETNEVVIRLSPTDETFDRDILCALAAALNA